MSVGTVCVVLSMAALLQPDDLGAVGTRAHGGAALAMGHRLSQAQPGDRDAKVIAAFQTSVKDYMTLHRKLEGSLSTTPEGGSPDQVQAHQRAMERLISESRSRTKQGSVFTSDVRAYFRRQLSRAFSGPNGRQLRASIMDENPGAIRVEVNGRYPDGVPVSTVPPQVLLLLPALPDELEYRFIGDRLILLDAHANLVVDYMERAVPRG